MTTPEGRPSLDLAGYSLVLLNDVSQLTMEAVHPQRDGDPVLVRLTAFRGGEASTQVNAMLPDSPEGRAFARRVAEVGASGAVAAQGATVVRAASHCAADRLRAKVALPGEGSTDRIVLRIRAVEGEAANDVMISLADTPTNRDVAARVVRAIESAGAEATRR